MYSRSCCTDLHGNNNVSKNFTNFVKIKNMYKIFHNIDGEKTSVFNSDSEFINFVRRVAEENEDGDTPINNVEEAKNYINVYCENLDLIL